MMKRIAILTVCAILLPAWLAGQTTEPEDPGLTLPPVVLEISDIESEEIEAVLPVEEDSAPGITAVLPEAGDLRIPDQLIPVTMAGDLTSSSGGSSFFSEGAIGFGIRNYILGDISLYKIGSQPRFNLRFLHEQWDGFADHGAGEGFSLREDGITGALTLQKNAFSLTGEGAFEQDSRGLQGQSDLFTEVTHSAYRGSADMDYAVTDTASFVGGMSVSSGTLLLSGEEPEGGSELILLPKAGFRFSWPGVELSFIGRYRYTGITLRSDTAGNRHFAGFAADFSAELPAYVDISLSVGVDYGSATSWRVPFAVSLAGQLAPPMSFSLEGGYREESHSFSEIWDLYPFTDIALLDPAYLWYGGVSLSWTPGTGVTLNGSVRFESSDGALCLSEGGVSESGLLSLYQSEVMGLVPSVDIRLRPTDTVTVTAGWSSRFLDTESLERKNVMDFGVEYESRNGSLGLTTAGEWDLFPSVAIPIIRIEGFYRLTEGVMILLEARDLLAPLVEGGRIDWEPYIGQGFEFVIKTQISL